MKLKLITIALFALALPAALAAWPQTANTQSESTLIMLNVRGVRERGAVRFDHQAHQGRLNPDPNAAFKASATASCAGCHHSTNETGVPQLWKCTVCHQTEGRAEGKGAGQYVNKRCGQQCETAGNPKNCQCDELYFERAFHDSCIGCHRANNEQTRVNRAPTTCSGCHAARQ